MLTASLCAVPLLGVAECVSIFGSAYAALASFEYRDPFRCFSRTLQVNRHGTVLSVPHFTAVHDEAKLIAHPYRDRSFGLTRHKTTPGPPAGVVVKIPYRETIDAAEPFLFFFCDILETIAGPSADDQPWAHCVDTAFDRSVVPRITSRTPVRAISQFHDVAFNSSGGHVEHNEKRAGVRWDHGSRKAADSVFFKQNPGKQEVA